MSHLPPLTPVHHQSRRPPPPLTRPRQPPTHEREFKKCRRTGGLHLLLMSKNSFFVPFLQKIPFLHMRHVVNERYSEKSHTTNSIKSPHDPLGTLQRKKRETRCPFSQLGGGGGLLRFVRDFFRCTKRGEVVFNGVFYFCFFVLFFSGLPCFGGISNGVSMVVQSISLCL